MPARSAVASFIVAGSGQAPEGKATYRDHVIRPNDLSHEGLREKMRFVMAEMENRLNTLGFAWQDAGSTQVYTVCNVGALVEGEIFARRRSRRTELAVLPPAGGRT